MKKYITLLVLALIVSACSDDDKNDNGLSGSQRMAMELSLKEHFKGTYSFLSFSDHKMIDCTYDKSPTYIYYKEEYDNWFSVLQSVNQILNGEEPDIPIILPPYKDYNTYKKECQDKVNELQYLQDTYKRAYKRPIYSVKAYCKEGESNFNALFILGNNMKFERMDIIH